MTKIEDMVLIPRSKWGAQPPSDRAHPLVRPIKHVLVHQTSTRECYTVPDCSMILRKLQSHYMDLGRFDIPFNFMIGPKGRVFEGRGWHRNGMGFSFDIERKERSYSIKKSLKSFLRTMDLIQGDFTGNEMERLKRAAIDRFRKQPKSQEILKNNRLYGTCLSVAIICDSTKTKKSPPNLVDDAIKFIKFGVEMEHIDPNYLVKLDLSHATRSFKYTDGKVCLKENKKPSASKSTRRYWAERFFNYPSSYNLL